MFTTLMVALDLDADGDRALPVVQALARTGSARVELVTVSSPGMPTDADAYELERRARRLGCDPDAWTIVHHVDAASGLVQHATRRDALLVMATTARRPWTPTMSGSVPREVLRLTDRPVLLIGPQVPATYEPRHTTLVPCIAAGDIFERAVPAIVEWQQTFVADAPQLAEVVPVDADQTEAKRRLDAMGDLLRAQHVHPAVQVVTDDDPVNGVGLVAARFAGAVFVATSARYTDGRLHWHSSTQQMIHRATCPVLVVPARPMPITLCHTDPAVAHHAFHDSTVPVVAAPA